MFKNKSKRKRNFVIYHFLVKSKPHERINLLITAGVNIYHTNSNELIVNNSNSNENMLFLRKTDETICKLPLSKRTLSFNQPPISEQFFHDVPLCLTFKNEIPPPLNIGEGEGEGGGNYAWR